MTNIIKKPEKLAIFKWIDEYDFSGMSENEVDTKLYELAKKYCIEHTFLCILDTPKFRYRAGKYLFQTKGIEA